MEYCRNCLAFLLLSYCYRKYGIHHKNVLDNKKFPSQQCMNPGYSVQDVLLGGEFFETVDVVVVK